MPDAICHSLPSADASPVFDGEIKYSGNYGSIGKCRIRLFHSVNGDADSDTVVVCTELPDNTGTCVTGAAATIATMVWTRLKKPKRFVWIEHYSERCFIGSKPLLRETFELVEFEYDGERFSRPRWRCIDKREVERLCVSQL